MTAPRALPLTLAVLLGVAVAAGSAAAQTVRRTHEQATQTASSAAQAPVADPTRLDARDHLLAQLWNLTDEEMQRAKVLLEGPRKSFSVENLSPVEALGIHARSAAEREKYAEKFARAFHQDVERSLAWNRAFSAAMQRLYPNEAVVNYNGVAPVAAPVSAADALGVPRSLVTDTSRSASPLLPQQPAASRVRR